MHSSAWKLEAGRARLETRALEAELDLVRPDHGLRIAGAERLERALAVGLEAQRPSGGGPPSLAPLGELLDAYVRGDDLIAVYRGPEPRRLRIEVYWRGHQLSGSQEQLLPEGAGAIDLLVSVQTDLLDDRPRLETFSRVAAAEALECDSEGGCATAAAGERTAADQSHSCLWFPGVGTQAGYAEMIHPDDFQQRWLVRAGDGWETGQQLFAERLEKGVILRVRMRAALVDANCPPEAAAARVAACYRQLIEAPLPLTV